MNVLRGNFQAPRRDVFCVVHGCLNRQHALGLCTMHYKRMERSGVDADLETTTYLRRPPEPSTCVCDVDVVRVYLGLAGSVSCKRCHRPPAESFGIHWTQELVESHRADPRVPTYE